MAVSHVVLAGAAAAQNYPKVAPQLPEATPPAQMAPPEGFDASRNRSPDAADPVLLPVLKGVVFVDGPFALKREGLAADAAGQRGVSVGALEDLDAEDFRAAIVPYVGRPLLLSDLDEIRSLVRARYVKAGKPFLDVSAPPQNVTSGIVQIVVTQYRLGAVTVSFLALG
jgi:hemolysin activation/secretion protein